jgi:indolepyruvate ferredoxin oxidoreductase alpha subunit
MTGGQDTPRLDFAQLVTALGVRPERVRAVDPYELPAFFKVLREEIKAPEPSVIIAERPCVLSRDFVRRRPLAVLEEKCNGCARCLDVGCPAITVTRRARETRASGKFVERAWVRIEAGLCTGCDVCAKACARGAIPAS